MIRSQPAFLFVGLLVALLGCGGSGSPAAPGGGTGNRSGSDGFAGMGGVGGTGTAGRSGTGGTGNDSGTGGTGPTGVSIGGGPDFAPVGSACNTNVLCFECPSDKLCDSDDDCPLAGSFCGSTGCTSDDGRMIGRCQGPLTPSCVDDSDCPDSPDHECATIGFGDKRCLRTTPGCNPLWESIDCPVGYACEGGSCIDRRVPCDDLFDCPKSHTCEMFPPTQSFCVRIYRDCNEDADCGQFASRCADVDGDGRSECTGEIGEPAAACVNATCGSRQVCENGGAGVGTSAECGDYGLCLDHVDCPSGFECLALGADGRKECVPSGPRGCDATAECGFNQVCASGRSGGTPECQAGTAHGGG